MVVGQLGEEMSEPRRGLETAELDASTIGRAQPSDHHAQQLHRCGGMRLEIRPELGGSDLLRRHLTPRDDGRPAHLAGVVDRRQLADEVALVAHAEQRLPAILGRAEHLDGAARDQHDVIGAITLAEQHAARGVAARSTEGDQIVPVL